MPVRQVQPQRHEGCRAIGSTGGERNMEDAKPLGDTKSPANEDISDYTKRTAILLGYVTDEVLEVRLEGP